MEGIRRAGHSQPDGTRATACPAFNC